MSKIYVIIAAYNEGSRLGALLQSLQSYAYQVVVVNDGSRDDTAIVASQYPVILLSHQINRGQGAALATGTEYALKQGADIIVHFDADGQHLAQEIERVTKPIITGQAEIVFGSKFLQANRIPFFKKYFIIKPALLLNNFLTGIRLTDVHNGFRALSGQAAAKIEMTQDAMAHNTEIVMQTKKLGLKYKEVPVTIIYHEFGQGFRGGIKILFDLLFKRISQ